MQQRWSRDLKNPDFTRTVLQALGDADESFFQGLGKVLEVSDIETDYKIQYALIQYWLPGDKTTAGFCHLSDPLLAKILNILFGRNHLNPEMVRKKWVRLGLKKVKGKHFTSKSEWPSGPNDIPPWDPGELKPPPDAIP